jgi:hypothetical protein
VTKSETSDALSLHLLERINKINALQNELLTFGKEAIAVRNQYTATFNQVLIGLMDWRRGDDPRPQFEIAVDAHEHFLSLARDHGIQHQIYYKSTVLAMFALMGQTVDPSEEDGGYYKMNRWPLYTSCVAHALHNVALDSRRAELLSHYLSKHNVLEDKSVKTYLMLTGVMTGDRSTAELVVDGNKNWEARKSNRSFAGASVEDGYGNYNSWFVDILLAASIKKAGWDGDGIHVWRWG